MIAVDTNILLLYVVGRTRVSLIESHKRLDAYRAEDFGLLVEEIGDQTILLTPNTLSEVSNLLVPGVKEPLRSALRAELGSLIATGSEVYVPSEKVASDPFFHELGLADCALLEACSDGSILLTVDIKLFLAAGRRGLHATNFNHVREATF